MANNEKSPIKERIAAAKQAQESVKAAAKEARVRTVCAWTIAKTMLPKAPAEVQQHFASALLGASTPILKAALRQTAINAHWTKFAETYESVHKKDLNDLLPAASELSTEKAAVSKEMKGDVKNATVVTADDRSDAGPQPTKYDDGTSKWKKDPDMDASGSEVRPDDTVNKTDPKGTEKENSVDNSARVTAASKTAKCWSCGESVGLDPNNQCNACGVKNTKKSSEEKTAEMACTACGKMGCMEHAAASAKKADEPVAEEAPAAEAEAEAVPEEAPVEEAAAPAEEAAPAPEEEAATLLTEEKKEDVAEQIADAQQAIQNIEETILEEGQEELDFNQIFSQPEDKVDSLANEGEEAPEENEDFFGPSEDMETATTDENSMENMFASADSDPLASLIASAHKEAEQVDGMEVVPSFTGEAAKHFESEIKETEERNSTADHDGDLWAEVIEDQKPEDSGQTFCESDKHPVMEAPKAAAKAAAKKPATIKKVKAAAGAPEAGSLADLLFPGDVE